jgi:hypothetical protein
VSTVYLLEGLIVRRLYLKRLLTEEKLINKEKAERLVIAPPPISLHSLPYFLCVALSTITIFFQGFV